MILSSIADMLIIPVMAIHGILMAPLQGSIVAAIFVAAFVLALALDFVKAAIFSRLQMV